MTIRNLYEQIGGDFDDVLKRFGNEEVVKRFVLKFLNDECFWSLKKSLSENDVKTAFRAAHTLKGVCLNLGFGNLSKASSEITEVLRAGELEKAKSLLPVVEARYAEAVAFVRMFNESNL